MFIFEKIGYYHIVGYDYYIHHNHKQHKTPTKLHQEEGNLTRKKGILNDLHTIQNAFFLCMDEK